jgi:hypothetical protein
MGLTSAGVSPGREAPPVQRRSGIRRAAKAELDLPSVMPLSK